MKERQNWLFVKNGSFGEIEEVRWIKDKSYDEIVEIGKKEFEENKECLLEDGEDMEEYVEEWCEWNEKKDYGVMYGLSEEESECFISEDLCGDLVDVDFEKVDEWSEVEELLLNVMESVCIVD